MENIIDIISVIGTLLSLVGVIFAIVQIRKTRQAAEAAKSAADQTKAIFSRNILLTDISTCARSVEEIKFLIRGSRYEAALIKVSDLSTQLIQLKQLANEAKEVPTVDFQQILTQLSVLRDLLETKFNEEETEINPAQVNIQLSVISDGLNEWVGEKKFSLMEIE